MEPELENQPPDDGRKWPRSLAMLALLIAFVVAVQLWGVRARKGDAEAGSSVREQALISGDVYIKLDQARPSGSMTAVALRSYRKALPWPSAYRRLGVMKESYGRSGLEEFLRLDSKQATRGMDKKEIAKLRREKAMWLRIFSPPKLAPDEARRYVKQIESLNLGPLKTAAAAQVYWRAGQHDKYEEVRAASRAAARLSVGLWISLLAVLIVGGSVGFVGALVFLTRNALRFADAPLLTLRSSMLISAFIVYLASYIGLSGLAELLSDAAGLADIGEWSGLAYMGLVVLSAGAAFGLGLLTLVGRAKILGQDWRQIGFRTANVGRDVLLGVAGFFGSLPFVFGAAVVALILSKTVFRHFPTPDQALNQIVTQGSALEIAMVFFAASVVAPVVEETFFRGVLYSGFRTRMRVWPSVLVTSAIFAVIHPLPGGFLPIFALACVLALLRERSGLLLPGIACHCVYNTFVLVITTMVR